MIVFKTCAEPHIRPVAVCSLHTTDRPPAGHLQDGVRVSLTPINGDEREKDDKTEINDTAPVMSSQVLFQRRQPHARDS